MKDKMTNRLMRCVAALARPFICMYRKLRAWFKEFAPLGYQDEKGFHLGGSDRLQD